MIEVKNLSYQYTTFEKNSGFYGSLKDFFNRKYSKITALDGIHFKIERGESVGLLGVNGAGKTTLIKLLTGIIEATSGEISCLNHNPYTKDKSYLKNIGVVLGQKSQLIWDLPAKETLLMLKTIYDIKRVDFDKKLKELCTLLNVEHKLNTPVRKLSWIICC